MNRKLALAKWVKVELSEIKEAALEVQKKINWIELLGGIVLAIVVAAFMALPWLTEGQ